jgi:hypothetical protein
MAENLTLIKQLKEWELDETTKYNGWGVVKSKYYITKNSNINIKCNKCNKDKPCEDFKPYRTIDNNRKKLYYSRRKYCRECANLYVRKWRYEDPNKVELLLLEDTCQICNDKFKSDRNKFIDHCHATNKIRGVLCTKCNTLLGMIERKKQILNNINKYLK